MVFKTKSHHGREKDEPAEDGMSVLCFEAAETSRSSAAFFRASTASLHAYAQSGSDPDFDVQPISSRRQHPCSLAGCTRHLHLVQALWHNGALPAQGLPPSWCMSSMGFATAESSMA